jgi:hypothetical protein
MSTSRSAELTLPSSSPFATFVLGTGPVGLTVEFVTLTDEFFKIVVVATGGGVNDVTGTVLVVLSRVEVVTARAPLSRWCPAGVVLEPVSVKTRTSSSRGLDHISR